MHTCKPPNRPSHPFGRIGVLVKSSGNLEGILAQAGFLAAGFNASLLVIHSGKQTLKLKSVLDEIRVRYGGRLQDIATFRLKTVNIDTLSEICREDSIDLLILETARRESVFCYFPGSLARNLSRTAQCSLLLLPAATIATAPFKKIIIRGISNPKTPFTLNAAIAFAHYVGTGELTVVTELDQPGLSMATAFTGSADSTALLKKQIAGGEIEKIHAMVKHCQTGGIPIIEEIISGRQGYAIREFSRNCHADLLVINSPDAPYRLIDRIFTHDMEYILEDLSCNVLIVHSAMP